MAGLADGLTSGGIGGAAQRFGNWAGQRNAPQIGENPYMGQWGTLLSQLQQQAAGQGPSLAQNAYREAHDQGMAGVQAMSRGGSAGAARGGMNMMGRMNQGLAQGYSNARLQEQLAARQQLQAALTGAGNAWFQPQQMNLQAMMGTPTNLQTLLNMLQQGGMAGAQIASMGKTPVK